MNAEDLPQVDVLGPINKLTEVSNYLSLSDVDGFHCMVSTKAQSKIENFINSKYFGYDNFAQKLYSLIIWHNGPYDDREIQNVQNAIAEYAECCKEIIDRELKSLQQHPSV